MSGNTNAPSDMPLDVAIIGAGAAGLATAIFAARARPGICIAALDGAKKLGAKILVSGGGRCNVTNARVADTDFFGGNRNVVRRVLKALPVEATIGFFREIGVSLHEEPLGKLFPDSNSAKTVLEALLREVRRLHCTLHIDSRVIRVARASPQATDAAFDIFLANGIVYRAGRVVLATGGRSLPKTGSDGLGYELAKSLGHTVTQTTPALAPLVLNGTAHAALSGIAHDVELTLRADDEKPVRVCGAMLWTHFGISGPAALDISRFWHRAALDHTSPVLTASVVPGRTADGLTQTLVIEAAQQGRMRVVNWVSGFVPSRVAEFLCRAAGVPLETTLAQLQRDSRRKLVETLTALPLAVRDSRGYTFAEVTAGGVPLNEIDTATMESRICPGLHFVGEILDVDGRIGGFNFQWAWCTAAIAGRAVAQPPGRGPTSAASPQEWRREG